MKKHLSFEERYWHKLTEKELKEVSSANFKVGELLDTFKQPDWCGYPEALSGMFGCWALMSKSTKINESYCKGCDQCNLNKQKA